MVNVNPEELAIEMYEAYAANAGWLTLRGHAMDPWDELQPGIKNNWIASAVRAMCRLGQPPEGYCEHGCLDEGDKPCAQCEAESEDQ